MKRFPDLFSSDFMKIQPLKSTLEIFIALAVISGKAQEHIEELLQSRLKYKVCENPSKVNIYCFDKSDGSIVTWMRRFRKRAWLLTHAKDNVLKMQAFYTINGFLWKIPPEFAENWKILLWVFTKLFTCKELIESKQQMQLHIDYKKFAHFNNLALEDLVRDHKNTSVKFPCFPEQD